MVKKIMLDIVPAVAATRDRLAENIFSRLNYSLGRAMKELYFLKRSFDKLGLARPKYSHDGVVEYFLNTHASSFDFPGALLSRHLPSA